MAKKYLDYDGLLYFWQKIKTLFVPVTRTVNSKALSADISLTASDVGAAPTSHKSTATTYGVGDSSNYGHLKLSDSTSSTTSTSGGTAATPKAVKDALDAAKAYVNGDTLIYDKVNTDGTVHVWNYDDDRSFNFLEGTALQAKIDGIAAGAEVNVQSDWNQTTTTADDYIKNKPTIPTLKNVFGKVKVGSTTIEADTTQDTLELVAGSNVTLTPDATNDKVTIAATDTTYSEATTSAAGLMSASDKTKLNGIAVGAVGAEIGTSGTVYLKSANGSDVASFQNGAEVNVQSDWNQTTTTADDYIKNKPTLGAAAAKGVITSISSDSTDLPTVTAVKGYVDTAVAGATSYQGIAPTSFEPTNYKAGWYWIVGTAGTYCGQVCEAGDMIFCKTAASTYSAANFDVVQTNLDITSITNAEIDTIVAA